MGVSKTVESKNFVEPYREVIQSLVERFGARLKTVVLFGSRARQESRQKSDHDLFVVIENLSKDPVVRQREVREILLPILDRLPGPISFLAKTPEEVNANLSPLLLDVCVDGVCLFGEDYFEPYRQRALAALRSSRLRRQRIGETWMWVYPQLPKVDWELTWEGYREAPR